MVLLASPNMGSRHGGLLAVDIRHHIMMIEVPLCMEAFFVPLQVYDDVTDLEWSKLDLLILGNLAKLPRPFLDHFLLHHG